MSSRRCSCADEFGLALLGERGQALVGVLGPEQRLHQLALEREALVKRLLAALVDAALDGGLRHRGAGGETPRVLANLGLRLTGVVHVSDQAELAGVVGAIGPAGDHELERAGRPDQASETLGSTVARGDP